MKMAKSYKILSIFVLTFAMVVCVALGTMFMPKVQAASSKAQVTDFINFSNVTDYKFEKGNEAGAKPAIVATLKKDSSFKFKNKLVISDLAIAFDIAEGDKLNVKVLTDSYYVNGNKNKDGKFDKEIANVVSIEGNAGDVEEKLVLGVSGSKLTAVGGEIANDTASNGEDYYKIQNVAGISVGTVIFENVSDKDVVIKLYSVDQKQSDDSTDSYKQTFELDNNGMIKDYATPRAVVNTSFYTQESKGVYVAKRMVSTGGNYESISATLYSVAGNVKSSSVYLTAENAKGSSQNANVALESGTQTPKKIAFIKAGDASFNLTVKIDGKECVCDTVNVKVLSADTESAPYYKYDEKALEAFNAALKEQYKKVDENNKETSVPLGTTLKIPSMEDLVFDDITTYSNLEVLVYYSARTSGSSTKLEFDLDEVGEYKFYVAFADEAGNTMEEEDFMSLDENDKVVYGKYGKDKPEGDGNFIFSFVLDDDAEIIVTPAIRQGIGYKGVKYEASKFTIKASGCTLTYKLFYNPNKSATEKSKGWVEIPKASTITDENHSKNGFTYDMIKQIGYDGGLKFTPHETGAFMIECTATSKDSPRTATAKSIIKVQEKKQEVKPDDKWVENNIASIIFLSIGGVCLIAIVVLLFIKPKDKKEKTKK